MPPYLDVRTTGRGTHSVGAWFIIAPFVVFALPVYTIAGVALMGSFATSAAGAAFFQLLAATGLAPGPV